MTVPATDGRNAAFQEENGSPVTTEVATPAQTKPPTRRSDGVTPEKSQV